jgi:anti-sigma B factor antagonist
VADPNFQHIDVTMVKDVAVVEVLTKEMHSPQLAAEFGDEVAKVSAQDWAKRLVINFKGLSFLSSTAFAMLFKLVQRAKDEGRQVKVCEMQHGVRLGAEIAGLHKLIEIYETEREALAAF